MVGSFQVNEVLAKEVTPKLLEEAIKKRESYGLSTEEGYVSSLIEEDIYSSVWNIYMTPEEEQEVFARGDKQQAGMDKFLAFLELHPEVEKNIKDKYIDQSQKGVLYLIVRDEKAASMDVLMQYIKEFKMFPIKISDKKLSGEELSKKMDAIWDNREKLKKAGITVNSSAENVVKQQIDIGISNNDKSLETNKQTIASVTGLDEELLHIEFMEAMVYETMEEKVVEQAGKTEEPKILEDSVIEEKSWWNKVVDFIKSIFTN